jgi:O-antigen/teichoic acid export membrane protein
VNPVVMPAIFAQIRTGGGLKRIYLNAVELISAVQWPFLITFALMADQIILLWFGPTWTEIIPLIRLLCLASLSLFAACLTYPVLVAAGRIRDTLTSSLISLPPSLLVVFVSSFFGVQAVAASALLTLPFQAGVALYFVSKHLAISPTDLYRATVKSGVVTFCSTIGVLLSAVMAEVGWIGPIAQLLLGGFFAAVGWILGLIVSKHPLLVQMRQAAKGIALAAPWLPVLGQWGCRLGEKAS